MTLAPIPTTYRGTRMRSRTEARFARWCDDHVLTWVYEPEGYAIRGQSYLPDFWLPQIRCIVEIKPPMFLSETSKMLPLVDDPETKNINFLVATMEDSLRPLLFWDEWSDIGYGDMTGRSLYPNTEGNFFMAWCDTCMAPIFCGNESWACRQCGRYDGNGHHAAGFDFGIRCIRKDAVP